MSFHRGEMWGAIGGEWNRKNKTMKKTLLSLLVGVGVGGFAFSGSAATYRDTDSFGLFGTKVSSGNELVGYFQIDSNDADGIPDVAGYNPTSQQIISASVAFLLGDDLDLRGETVDILLGSSLFLDAGSVPALINWTVGAVTGTALFDLQADGVLKYTIASDSGDFMAYKAVLQAEAGPKSQRVPDGGMTVAFLGLSMVALGLARRRVAI